MKDTTKKNLSTWSPDRERAVNESSGTRRAEQPTDWPFSGCVTLSVSRWGLKGKQGPPPAVGNRRKVYRERGQRRAGKAPSSIASLPLLSRSRLYRVFLSSTAAPIILNKIFGKMIAWVTSAKQFVFETFREFHLEERSMFLAAGVLWRKNWQRENYEKL